MAKFYFNSISPRNLDDYENPLSPIKLPALSTRNESSQSKFKLSLSPRFSSLKKNSDILNTTTEHSIDTQTSAMTSPKSFRLKRPERSVIKSFEIDKFGKIITDDNETYRQRLNTPYKNERVVSEDEQPIRIMGEDSVKKFYNHYKKLDKIKDINNFYAVKDSVYTNFLSKTESLQLLPSKVGFIKDEGDINRVKLK